MRVEFCIGQRLHRFARAEGRRAVALVLKHQRAQTGQRILGFVVNFGVNIGKLIALFALKIGLLEDSVLRNRIVDDFGKQLCPFGQNVGVVQRVIVAQRVQRKIQHLRLAKAARIRKNIRRIQRIQLFGEGNHIRVGLCAPLENAQNQRIHRGFATIERLLKRNREKIGFELIRLHRAKHDMFT